MTIASFRPFIFTLSLWSALSFSAVHHAEAFVHSLQNHPHPGKAIFEQFCSVCHAEKPQISLGAPRIGHQADWEKRLKQYGKKEMFTHTADGMGAMPPRGGCFECSDEQLEAAIVYLVTSEPRP